MRVHFFQHVDDGGLYQRFHVGVFHIELVHVVEEGVEFLALFFKIGLLRPRRSDHHPAQNHSQCKLLSHVVFQSGLKLPILHVRCAPPLPNFPQPVKDNRRKFDREPEEPD